MRHRDRPGADAGERTAPGLSVAGLWRWTGRSRPFIGIAVALILVGVMAAAAVAILGPDRATRTNADAVAGSADANGMDRSAFRSDRGAAIAVPQVGLEAQLTPIAFVGSVLEPPADVTTAGLWDQGAPLAAKGDVPSVIAGHVSDGEDRAGAFHALWDVDRGMLAETRDAEGRLREWRVVAVHTYPKEALPRGVFLPSGRRVLRLITCDDRVVLPGGRFHYAANLVVDLVPESGSNPR